MTRRHLYCCVLERRLRTWRCDSEAEADLRQERHGPTCAGTHFAVAGSSGASFEVLEHQVRQDLATIVARFPQ